MAFTSVRDVDPVATPDFVAVIVYVPAASDPIVYTPLEFDVVDRPFDSRTVAPATRAPEGEVMTPIKLAVPAGG